MVRARGIDVSHHRPVKDWAPVLNAGINFVGVKATEGRSYMDPKFVEHRAGVRSQPFDLVIYYHFFNEKPPEKQAAHFMDTVGQLRANERLALDVEVDKDGNLPLPPISMLGAVDKFYTILMGAACTDRRPLIYTSKRIWQMFGDPNWDLALDVDLWVPRYSSSEPLMPKPWAVRGWTIWQFTDGDKPVPHSVPGVGRCDGNYFQGDVEALKTYARLNSLAEKVS